VDFLTDRADMFFPVVIGIGPGDPGYADAISTDDEEDLTATAAGYNDTGSDFRGATVDEVELAVGSPAVTGDGYDVNAASGAAWEGVLAVEGIKTGDGRMFSDGAMTWTGEPMVLRWNKVDSHGGTPQTQAVNVGRIDMAWRDPARPNFIMGKGVFDEGSDDGREALRRVSEGFLSGVSIDPDNISDADVELVFPEGSGESELDDDMIMELFQPPELTIFHAGRLRAATLVDIPAFVEAKIWLPSKAPAEVAAMSTHFGEISDRVWSASTHEQRLRQSVTKASARQAFAHVAASGSVARFLHHEVDEASSIGLANLTACSAGIRAINAGRAEQLTESERRESYDHLAGHLRAAGLVPPPYESTDAVVASLTFEHLIRPPAEWFANPQLTEPTPLTVTDDGRVFGHGAQWGTCHTGFADVCREPPVEGEHSYYRLGEKVLSDGSRVAVGNITLETGHAPTRNISARQAVEHYDNTGAVVADVVSGEDDHGIWVAGAIRPGVSEARVQELRSAKLSGDWRRFGGQLRLVAFLAVNVPGFAVPRTQLFIHAGRQLSLVAAGIVSDARPTRRSDGTHAALMRIARSIGRDPESRMAELRSRMGR
jgi:hypothetical protein